MYRIVVLICLSQMIVLPFRAQEPTKDGLAALRSFIGTWEGTGTDGSKVTHTYEKVVSGQFILTRTTSFDKNGQLQHEDLGMFSFDQERNRVVFRQFLSEGFVNTYVMAQPKDNRLVFTSESCENAGGMKARLTYIKKGDNSYESSLELASPGKDFFVCQSMTMKRVN